MRPHSPCWHRRRCKRSYKKFKVNFQPRTLIWQNDEVVVAEHCFRPPTANNSKTKTTKRTHLVHMPVGSWAVGRDPGTAEARVHELSTNTEFSFRSLRVRPQPT